MRALLQLTSLPDNYRLRVHYSLGKAHDDLGEYAEAVRHFDAANRLACRTQKFDRAQFAAGSRRLAKSFTRDSSPANFMWSGLIHLVFPQARILHCRRNPVDTCLSNYFTNFSAAMLFTNSKADLAFYYANTKPSWRTGGPSCHPKPCWMSTMRRWSPNPSP